MKQSELLRPRSICTAFLALVLGALLGGCAQAPLKSAPWAASTSTNQWNDHATDLIARNAVGQFPAVRTLAYMNLAINNAIVMASADGLASDGAAAGAAATVLAHLYPKEEQAITARLQREIQAL